MALHPVNPRRERRGEHRPCVASCPVCEGNMHVIYARNNRQVCACEDCGTTVTIPPEAWTRMRHRTLRPLPPEGNL